MQRRPSSALGRGDLESDPGVPRSKSAIDQAIACHLTRKDIGLDAPSQTIPARFDLSQISERPGQSISDTRRQRYTEIILYTAPNRCPQV